MAEPAILMTDLIGMTVGGEKTLLMAVLLLSSRSIKSAKYSLKKWHNTSKETRLAVNKKLITSTGLKT